MATQLSREEVLNNLILESEFGKRYNLADPGESAEWLAAGAVEKCSAVIRKGVRIAAEIIFGRTS